MARLPNPGGDNGTWGEILNQFLEVSHNSNGTIKASAISSKADDDDVVHASGNENIGGIKTFTSSPVVPEPTNATDAANKDYVDNIAVGGAPDADSSTKGLIQLAGDLTGTAASPQIASGVIVNADINASAAIAQSKISNLTTDLSAKVDKSTLTARGSLLTASATSTPAALAIGSSGKFLRSDGTDPSWANITHSDVGDWDSEVKELVDSTDITWTIDDLDHTASGNVVAIRNNSVESGTPTLGDAYIWDGSKFARTSVTIPLASDAGVTYSNSTTPTSLFAGTKYDIPANSLQVGDIIEVVAFGTYLNNSGAGRDISLAITFDGTTVGGGNTGVFTNTVTANATARPFYLINTIRVASIGATGSVNCGSSFVVGPVGGFGVNIVNNSNLTTTTIDTTQALTIDLTSTLSAATSTQTVTCKGITVNITRAP